MGLGGWVQRGKNNIIEGDPHGSGAPVVTCGAIKSRSAFSPDGLSACLSGTCLGLSWGPHLGQNLWGMGA